MRAEPPQRPLAARAWLPLAGLLLPLAVLVLWPLLRGHTFLHEDIVYYFFGLRRRLYLGLSAWNPFTSMGLPLIGDGQSAPFYPLNLPYYLLPTSLALPLATGLNLIAGSLMMWGWLGHHRLGPFARAVGALVFVWSGFFWLHLHHLTFLSAGVWIPGLFWGVDLLLDPEAPRGRGLALIAASTGLMLLGGGSPQLALYGGYGALAYGALGGAALGRRASAGLFPGDRPTARPGLRGAALGALQATAGLALGALSAAVALLPFAFAALERFEDTTAGYARTLAFSLPLKAGLRLFVPDALGNPFYGPYLGEAYWEEGISVGLITLALIPLGLRAARDWRGAFFFGLMILSFLGMLGGSGPVHPLLYWILPGYSLFRAPGRLYLLFTLGASVLAALGLGGLGGIRKVHRGEGQGANEGALRGDPDKDASPWRLDPEDAAGSRRILLRVLLPCILLASGVGLALGAGVAPLRGGALALGSGIAGAWIFGRLGAGAWTPSRAQAALTLLLAVELTLTGLAFNHTVPRAFAEDPTATDAALANLHDARPLTRVMVDDAAPPRYLNAGMEVGYLGLRGYNPLNPKALNELLAVADGDPPGPHPGGIVAQVEDIRSPVLGLMAAGILLTEGEPEGGDAGLTLLSRDAGTGLALYEDPRALPRVYLPGAVEVHPDPVARGDAIRRAALIRPPPLILEAPPPSGHLGPTPGQILAVRDDIDTLEIDLERAGPGFVVIADTYARGWEATLEGEAVPIVRAYGGMRAVPIEGEGPGTVILRYRAPGLRLGAALSLLSWLGIGALAWRGRRRGRGAALSP